jgi:hypothetical protein
MTNKNFEEDCNIDDHEELRTSQVETDFYTQSIGEASASFLQINNNVINNLPKPFVKQAKNEESSDFLYRNLLFLSKKGDRDCFLETLSKLCKKEGMKVNINYVDESGWSPLHYACEEGNLKIVEILIKMNVDVNFKTKGKKTPLHLAADKGYFDISRILIENGATLSTLDDEKNNVIHICSNRGHFELLKYFLEKYPQADVKNIYGKTPLDLSKNSKIKKLLEEYLEKKTSQYHKITIHNTSKRCANELITKGKTELSSKKVASNLNVDKVSLFSTTTTKGLKQSSSSGGSDIISE